MNENYSNIKRFTSKFYKNLPADIYCFIDCVKPGKQTPFNLLIMAVKKYEKLLSSINKHDSKKVNTSKWKKKKQEFDDKETYDFGLITVLFSSAHHYQTQVLKFLWLTEQKNNDFTIKNSPDTYSSLMRSLNTFSNSQRQLLSEFNKVRNIFAHSPLFMINHDLRGSVLLELITLLENLVKLDSFIESLKAEKISRLLDKEISLISS
ncbi:MAG: hypothetical protein DRG78_12735 [Epsilonproteobacteria bacterium]|nr:MAG: hypothetical protein DRG78_12735 [Campylobacterota bacterium]